MCLPGHDLSEDVVPLVSMLRLTRAVVTLAATIVLWHREGWAVQRRRDAIPCRPTGEPCRQDLLPERKGLVRLDLTGTMLYFVTPSDPAAIASDFTSEQQRDFTFRKEILLESRMPPIARRERPTCA